MQALVETTGYTVIMCL